ncbi:hypothetical protein [Streptomyces sp. ALB3]|uniref:hypothetical protein n=1 Tax=Streptomyces sp. ALB3 TaxID=3374278 RepID=UPI0037ADAED9
MRKTDTANLPAARVDGPAVPRREAGHRVAKAPGSAAFRRTGRRAVTLPRRRSF